MALGATTAGADVTIYPGSTPLPADGMLPRIDTGPSHSVSLSEGAVEALYPGGPISIRTEGEISISTSDGVLLLPHDFGTAIFEITDHGDDDSEISAFNNRIQTRGADLYFDAPFGLFFGTGLWTRSMDSDARGGNVTASADSISFGSIVTDGGPDLDSSGGNHAGNVRLIGGYSTTRRVSARGGLPGPGAPVGSAGDGGQVVVDIESAYFEEIDADAGGAGGLPGSVNIDGRTLLEYDLVKFSATTLGESVSLPADRGNVVFDGPVGRASQRTVSPTGDLVFLPLGGALREDRTNKRGSGLTSG